MGLFRTPPHAFRLRNFLRPSNWAGCGIVVAMVASADGCAAASFADELIGALTVLAQRQISEVVRLGLGRIRARDQPPRFVSGLQVPTGGTVATLLLAGQRREDLAVLARTLSNDTLSRKRDGLRVLVNKALDGDVRSFKAEWLNDLAVACELPPEAVRTLQAAYSRPGDLDPDRVEHVVQRLLEEYPRPWASQDASAARGSVSSGHFRLESPETTPGMLALLGYRQRAIEEALSIPYPMSKVGAISEIAMILSADDLDRATELVVAAAKIAETAHRELIPDPNELLLLRALVNVQLVEKALCIVMEMEEVESRARGFAILGAALALSSPTRAKTMVAQAERSVPQIDGSGWAPGIGGAQVNQSYAYAEIASILADFLPADAERILTKAGDTANRIRDARSKMRALMRVAEAVSGKFPEQAARFSEEADQTDPI